MQDVKATGYDSLCQTGVEEDSRLFWRSYRTFQGLKTTPFLSPGQKRNCGLAVSKWFANLSQTPTRSHAAGFGGKTVKPNSPTGVDWNDTTANGRERVGIIPERPKSLENAGLLRYGIAP